MRAAPSKLVAHSDDFPVLEMDLNELRAADGIAVFILECGHDFLRVRSLKTPRGSVKPHKDARRCEGRIDG